MRLILVFVGIGIGLLWVGYEELTLSRLARPEPTEMTLEELALDGPGDNAHVVMSDFLLCTFNYIYEENYGKWTSVWVPAVPVGGEYHRKLLSMLGEGGVVEQQIPMPRDIRVIVKGTGSLDEQKVEELAARDTLQGLVVNEIEKLSSEERRLLEESYPGVDFRSCWIFHEGREPAGTGKVAGLLGGGFASLALSGVFALFGLRRGRETPENEVVSEDAASPEDEVEATEEPVEEREEVSA